MVEHSHSLFCVNETLVRIFPCSSPKIVIRYNVKYITSRQVIDTHLKYFKKFPGFHKDSPADQLLNPDLAVP